MGLVSWRGRRHHRRRADGKTVLTSVLKCLAISLGARPVPSASATIPPADVPAMRSKESLMLTPRSCSRRARTWAVNSAFAPPPSSASIWKRSGVDPAAAPVGSAWSCTVSLSELGVGTRPSDFGEGSGKTSMHLLYSATPPLNRLFLKGYRYCASGETLALGRRGKESVGDSHHIEAPNRIPPSFSQQCALLVFHIRL